MTLPPDITKLIEEKRFEEAIEALTVVVDSMAEPDAALLCERGKLHWRLGHRRAATADYARSAEIDPEGPGAGALAMTRDIMDFFNPDMLNP